MDRLYICPYYTPLFSYCTTECYIENNKRDMIALYGITPETLNSLMKITNELSYESF